ncbi:ribbon-helix-helix domain-containing protein [Pseudoponticoccus marisrubri]|uniref:Aryl-sulfate sulfotransferase n=1 Tax=Pseudoponticoccus marisrubri TaxID=1685382 RepID=A0A0W7WEC8_9RHOB|nr:ribbon-helix-helix domain-containing protein [Pseudoponticoccus marisrubri]KUF08839.1 aryl-sulfate sulfotransferase [Pseudoponticoccus marisrubri]
MTRHGARWTGTSLTSDARSGRPVKRSLTLRGHRTSVSLEDAFWQAFREMAAADGKALNALASEIDAARDPDVGLASSIRVYVLDRLRRAQP